MNSCHMACIPKRKYCIIINHIINKSFDKLMKENSLNEMLQLLVNLVATWYATSTTHDHSKVAIINEILLLPIFFMIIIIFFDILIFV